MRDYNKNIVVTASILAAITIAIGAFGAHGLKQLVDAKSVATFENGVRYQMYHCLALWWSVLRSQFQKTLKNGCFGFFSSELFSFLVPFICWH